MVDQNLNAQHVSTHTPHMLPVLFFGTTTITE